MGGAHPRSCYRIAVPHSCPGGTALPARKATAAAEESTPAIRPVTTEGPEGPRFLPTRREIIVDTGGRGHFQSISDTVKVAGADDILLVRPGTYRESVTIEKSLTLVGDGPLKEIIVEADSGNAISFEAPFGRLVNLTIRRVKGGSDHYAVWIRAGRLELEGCDITSASSACIGITGDADPTIRRNRIHDGRSVGVLVAVKGRGTFEDNDIFANSLYGVLVQSEGNPIVRSNCIHKNKYEAVRVHENSQGTFEQNDPRDNARGPWDIAPECLPKVKRSENIEK